MPVAKMEKGVMPKKKSTKLKPQSKKVSVDPPKGYHWMEEGGRYYLMAGDYKPHPGDVAKASFKLTTHES